MKPPCTISRSRMDNISGPGRVCHREAKVVKLKTKNKVCHREAAILGLPEFFEDDASD
jgi:hypothetical protein